MWKSFSQKGFKIRRAKVMEEIGNGIAILQAAEITEAYQKI